MSSMFAEFESIVTILQTTTPLNRVCGATCLPHKDGGIPSSAQGHNKQALTACSPHYPFCAERQAEKLRMLFFQVL